MSRSLHSVLVVEDDAPMREHLADAVQAHPALTLQAACPCVSDALESLAGGRPDVLVTDLDLPDGSGLEVIRALRRSDTEALAMVVSVMGDEQSVVAAIQAGAAGYLLKDDSVDQIGASVLQLLQGGSPISPPIARYLLKHMRTGKPAAEETPAAEAPQLSPRELEVLSLVAKGFRFPEIAKLLEISAHTVTTYVRRIYAKLEVGSKGEAVYEAVHLGLLRLDE